MRHEPVTKLLIRTRTPQADDGGRNDYPLCASVAFLADHGFPRSIVEKANRSGIRNGTNAACEMLAHGLISEDAYYRSFAEHAGLPFVDAGTIADVLSGDEGAIAPGREPVWCRLKSGDMRTVFAPLPGDPSKLRLPQGEEASGSATAITTPSTLRAAVARRISPDLGLRAANDLANRLPGLSARHGASAWHGFALASLMAGGAAGIAVDPAATLLALHVLLSVFVLSGASLRMIAALTFRRAEPLPLMRFPANARPIYSVIVPLNREAPVVADLISALRALRWPRSKLEIKLVCEDGDTETLEALAEQKLDARFEVITVPLVGPQTKPKALNFALPFCTGPFVTLYDAEDRPHPEQLEEAWQIFHQSDDRLGALQAPLTIANPSRNWLTAQFHLEYAALFRGILRFLARHRLPVPLGGTSTHFRRSAIEDCGRWDPHNVTEDADLGFRMWRYGYRIGLIDRPTLEDAPESIPVWLGQRSRWIKGWIQTWLVHSRLGGPKEGENRLAGAIAMHVILAGTVICALLFPLTILTVAIVGVRQMTGGQVPLTYSWLVTLDWSNIAIAFAAQAILGLRTVQAPMRWLALKSLPAIPLYWLLSTVAGWRAARQFLTQPFRWEKTPHRPHDPKGQRHRL